MAHPSLIILTELLVRTIELIARVTANIVRKDGNIFHIRSLAIMARLKNIIPTDKPSRIPHRFIRMRRAPLRRPPSESVANPANVLSAHPGINRLGLSSGSAGLVSLRRPYVYHYPADSIRLPSPSENPSRLLEL
jgi:hypothetical protein